jgi:hypothetical protein
MSHIYGMAMPLLMRGMPVTPVQLENAAIPHYLDPFHILFLTYDGMKPLSAEPHAALVDWVKHGGVLVICDDDGDPYNKVQDWWNSQGLRYRTPRQDLFQRLGIEDITAQAGQPYDLAHVGDGALMWLRKNPADMAAQPDGDEELIKIAKKAASLAKTDWQEKNYLVLRRGPYVIAAGLDDSIGGESRILDGHFINLFDSTLAVQDRITVSPGSRYYLLDLDRINYVTPCVLAAACRVNVLRQDGAKFSAYVEGVKNTPAVVLMKTDKPPRHITLGFRRLKNFSYSAGDKLLRIYFTNEAKQRKLTVVFD